MARPKKLDRPVVISFALPSSLCDKLRSAAQVSGVKMSELLRTYVEKALMDTSAVRETAAHPGLKAAQMLKFEWLKSKVASLRADIKESEDPSDLEFEAKQLYDRCIEHLKENTFLSEKEVDDVSKNLRALLTGISTKKEDGNEFMESS